VLRGSFWEDERAADREFEGQREREASEPDFEHGGESTVSRTSQGCAGSITSNGTAWGVHPAAPRSRDGRSGSRMVGRAIAYDHADVVDSAGPHL